MGESDHTKGNQPGNDQPVKKRRKRKWGWDDLAEGAQESIILSKDRKTIPAGLVVDENGMVDMDKLSAEQYATMLEAQRQDPRLEQSPDQLPDDGELDPEIEFKRKRSLFAPLLHLLRQPENYLTGKYYASGFRKKLVDKYEWFSDYEGDSTLHNKLHGVYGGTDSPVRNTLFFVRNNLLASAIIVATGAYLTLDYLSTPVDNRYSNQVIANAKPSQGAPELTPVSIARDYSKVLNHCSVTAGLRRYFDGTEDNVLKSKVATEIAGFIRIYRVSEIENWHASQIAKHDIVVSKVDAAMPKISKYRNQSADRINKALSKRSKILGELEAITNSRSQKIRDVNRSVILRSKLANLEAELETGPSSAALAELDKQIDRLQSVTMGEKIELSADLSRWAVNTAMQIESRFISSITNVINQDVYGTIEQSFTGTPEARLYRMQILVTTLRHVGDLIGHLETAGNYFENRVGQKQNTSNQKLSQLLGSRDTQLLDYDNCLTVLNNVKGKLTSHP